MKLHIAIYIDERLLLKEVKKSCYNGNDVKRGRGTQMSEHFGMKNYMKGAAILTIAALIVKVLSAIYRVPFQNMVGDEGFYIYQQVYPFIAVFVVWTTSGVAVAISKLLADADAKGEAYKRPQVLHIVFVYLYNFVSVCFYCVIWWSVFFAHKMGDSVSTYYTNRFVYRIIMPMLAIIKR